MAFVEFCDILLWDFGRVYPSLERLMGDWMYV